MKDTLKLVIWDLDDTIWKGTLAENDTVVLNQNFVEYIKQINQMGVVNTLCSKNDYEKAKQQLEKFGIWDLFVFCRISFEPKGEVIKKQIEAMQLRAENVLFIDDNNNNLKEVEHFCFQITTMNPLTDNVDAFFENWIETNKHISKSRIEQYRLLEQKSLDQQDSELQGIDRAEFLKSMNIEAIIVKGADAIVFNSRIEELINRTNQLNFLSTRVKTGEIAKCLTDITNYDALTLFVQDKYGYHGLVGFAMIDIKKMELLHFTFSCRIMDMGIEALLLHNIAKMYPKLNLSHIPVIAGHEAWIQILDYNSGGIREFLIKKETKNKVGVAKIRIMANCQSAGIWHYAQFDEYAIYDHYPRIFTLQRFLGNQRQNFPEYLVYGAFNDYGNQYWSEENQKLIDAEFYRETVTMFLDYLKSINIKKIILLLPPLCSDEKKYIPGRGVTPERVKKFNNIWRDAKENYDFVSIVDLLSILEDADVKDVRHYEASGLLKISQCIRQELSDDGIFNDTESELEAV